MSDIRSARIETDDGTAVTLKGIKAHGDLRNSLLEMTITQEFVSASKKSAEVIYTFPLPWGAVLLGINVQLGDQYLTGLVVEKKQAEAQYEEAISDGNAAILLEVNEDQSYSVNIGNLAPGENCCITLRYVQTLNFIEHDGQTALRLLIPTATAPRYESSVQSEKKPFSFFSNLKKVTHDLVAEYPFEINIDLHGSLAQCRVASPSHPISVATKKDAMSISLARQGNLDRDFILVVDQLALHSFCTLSTDYVVPSHVALQASFCPKFDQSQQQNVAVKILVDCSGSMNGDSITAAKKALNELVGQLSPLDYFSLSCFGNDVSHRSRALWKTTDITKTEARQWVDHLNADMGGTEMEKALTSTFALSSSVRSDVLLITDGEISAIDSLITTAAESHQRVFIVGIGSSPAETHLQRLAMATGGACEFVAPGEPVAPAIMRMFARLRSPLLTKVNVTWPNGLVPIWSTPITNALFDGDTVVLSALFTEKPSGILRVLATSSSEALEPAEQEIANFNLDLPIDTETTSSRLGVARYVKALQINAGHGHDVAEQLKQLALDYQLISNDTSFILIHQREESARATTMPELYQVKHMLPAGWGGTSTVSDVCFSRSPSGGAMKLNQMVVRASSRLYSRDVSTDRATYLLKDKSDEGLTPIELAAWLQQTPDDVWPIDFKSLQGIGMDQSVMDWLALLLHDSLDELLTEQDVVSAFLKYMAQPGLHEYLLQCAQIKADPFNNLTMPIWQSVELANEIGNPNKLEKILEQVIAKLAPDEWPLDLFDELLELEDVTP